MFGKQWLNIINPHNSDEWFQCRRGIPTSSCFDKIVLLPGFFKQSEDYAYILLGERLRAKILILFRRHTTWNAVHSGIEASKCTNETGFTIDQGVHHR